MEIKLLLVIIVAILAAIIETGESRSETRWKGQKHGRAKRHVRVKREVPQDDKPDWSSIDIDTKNLQSKEDSASEEEIIHIHLRNHHHGKKDCDKDKNGGDGDQEKLESSSKGKSGHSNKRIYHHHVYEGRDNGDEKMIAISSSSKKPEGRPKSGGKWKWVYVPDEVEEVEEPKVPVHPDTTEKIKEIAAVTSAHELTGIKVPETPKQNWDFTGVRDYKIIPESEEREMIARLRGHAVSPTIKPQVTAPLKPGFLNPRITTVSEEIELIEGDVASKAKATTENTPTKNSADSAKKETPANLEIEGKEKEKFLPGFDFTDMETERAKALIAAAKSRDRDEAAKPQKQNTDTDNAAAKSRDETAKPEKQNTDTDNAAAKNKDETAKPQKQSTETDNAVIEKPSVADSTNKDEVTTSAPAPATLENEERKKAPSIFPVPEEVEIARARILAAKNDALANNPQNERNADTSAGNPDSTATTAGKFPTSSTANPETTTPKPAATTAAVKIPVDSTKKDVTAGVDAKDTEQKQKGIQDKDTTTVKTISIDDGNKKPNPEKPNADVKPKVSWEIPESAGGLNVSTNIGTRDFKIKEQETPMTGNAKMSVKTEISAPDPMISKSIQGDDWRPRVPDPKAQFPQLENGPSGKSPSDGFRTGEGKLNLKIDDADGADAPKARQAKNYAANLLLARGAI